MPDEEGNELADEDETPETTLHAHDEDRDEDIPGDPEPEVREDGDLDRGVGNPVGDTVKDDDDVDGDDGSDDSDD